MKCSLSIDGGFIEFVWYLVLLTKSKLNKQFQVFILYRVLRLAYSQILLTD